MPPPHREFNILTKKQPMPWIKFVLSADIHQLRSDDGTVSVHTVSSPHTPPSLQCRA
ncbi:hypothetical protein KIN20_020848 [Parelaphostrongylus tenuis]|uniref:Uncharacterized protein n=1 Tax=Parelaphostrongylus tenuis TaxID=148309 RepID=A0AAD5N4K6_PARTN|nr:hypothetical protein KIN20_020848 [Parelaphostrongylus tenuis]